MYVWLSNFLANYLQRVVINGCLHVSNWVSIWSGVPQGSFLGPSLFILNVNDIPDFSETNAKMFADDTRIYSVIKSFGDSLKLQYNIDRLMQWSSIWLFIDIN